MGDGIGYVVCLNIQFIFSGLLFRHICGAKNEKCTNLLTHIYRDIIMHKNTARTPWTRFQSVLKKEMSILGEGCSDVLAEKTITVKQCCIGNNVKIGVMAKLNNCVIMDNVTIGDK